MVDLKPRQTLSGCRQRATISDSRGFIRVGGDADLSSGSPARRLPPEPPHFISGRPRRAPKGLWRRCCIALGGAWRETFSLPQR